MKAQAATPVSARPSHDGATRARTIAERVAGYDWPATEAALDERGWAPLAEALTRGECDMLASLYPREEQFRSRVVMARHGFGRGEYKYFRYPLPAPVAELRASLYARLVAIANRWHELLALDVRFPNEHDAFIERCHRAGQQRPTPLLLQYGPEDYNCLHQDLYGEHVFPLQAVFLLSAPTDDFAGGEFVLTEQRPRMQSRVERSEEHTSELQSPCNLVCRLLLQKKKLI